MAGPASLFCKPEEDPFLLLESSLKAIERILQLRRGLLLRCQLEGQGHLGAVQCPYVLGGCRLDQHQAAGPPAGQDQPHRAAGHRRRPRSAGSGRGGPRHRPQFLLALSGAAGGPAGAGRPGAVRARCRRPAGVGADQQPPGPQPARAGAPAGAALPFVTPTADQPQA